MILYGLTLSNHPERQLGFGNGSFSNLRIWSSILSSHHVLTQKLTQ